MKLRNILTLLCLLIGMNSYSQQTGLITGTVQNSNTSELLRGVTILVVDNAMRTVTDSSGRFRISLPVGTYQIAASSVGYILQTK